MSEFVCPHCSGSTWVLADNGDAKPCECRAAAVRRAQVRGLFTHVPKKFDGVRYDAESQTFLDRERRLSIPPAVVRPIARYIGSIDERIRAGDGLWLEGDNGTGKTSVAMLVSKTAIKAGFTTAIYSVPHLLMEIRDTFEQSHDRSYSEFFARLTSVDLLHLDDLGAEMQTDWVIEQLYSIVNERYEREKSITVTTNLALPDLQEQIGYRTVSRLSEMCGAALLLYGPDRRLEHQGVEASRLESHSPVTRADSSLDRGSVPQ